MSSREATSNFQSINDKHFCWDGNWKNKAKVFYLQIPLYKKNSTLFIEYVSKYFHYYRLATQQQITVEKSGEYWSIAG